MQGQLGATIGLLLALGGVAADHAAQRADARAEVSVLGPAGLRSAPAASREGQAVERAAPSAVRMLPNLAYYDGPDADPRRQRLDLYLPDGAGPAPLLVFVHGGAWSSGDKSLYRWLGAQLAGDGVATAVINYRLVNPDDPVARALLAFVRSR